MPTFPVIPVKQPIGTFYISTVPADLLLRVVRIREKTLDDKDDDAVQRQLSLKRTKEIALYTTDPDATFPTPIIVACDDDRVSVENGAITFDENSIIGEVIDGQHRIRGLERTDRETVRKFDLPVVFMLDLQPYEKAYVFSTINSKQTPVPKSLIYQLFGLSELRSPYKTCHEIARALNASIDGPFSQGLKMLGKRNLPTEYLTQGSFVTNLLKRISKTPQADEIAVKKSEKLFDDETLPFRYYWINNHDEMIVKIIENYFGAIRDEFPKEWNHPTAEDYILRKTVGFVALLEAFDEIWIEAKKEQRADREFFGSIAKRFHDNLGERPLTADEFGSSAGDAGKLAKTFLGI
jgi:DGQHR domain-containing protein